MDRRIAIRLASVLAIAAGACEGASPTGTGAGPTAWELVALDPLNLQLAATFTSMFRAPSLTMTPDRDDPTWGMIDGHSGCNAFQGRYRATPGGEFALHSLQSTDAACVAWLSGLEIVLFRGLTQARHWRLEGQQLLLWTGDSLRIRLAAPARLYALHAVNSAPLPFQLAANPVDTTRLLADSIMLRASGVAVLKWRYALQSAEGTTIQEQLMSLPFLQQADSIRFASNVTCINAPCPGVLYISGTLSGGSLVLHRFAEFPASNFSYSLVEPPPP